MGELVTGSKLPIFRHCGWWARDDVSFPKRQSSAAGNNGTRMHDAFASWVEQGVLPPLTPAQRMLADQMVKFWGIRRASVGWRTELAFALNPSTRKARILGKDIGREYVKHGLDPVSEIGLSTDYVWAEEKGVPICGDWKTGYASHVEPPEENLQLLAGGAALVLATVGHLGP